MQNDKLLPCPFCGSELHKHYRYYHHEINGCIFDNYEFFKEDFDKWNTRKPMERIVEQLNDRISNLDNKNKICMDVGDFKSSDRYSERMCEVINAREIVEKRWCR